MRYRAPILQRKPFIIRRPIIDRTPIIDRFAIFNRKSVTSQHINYDGCMLTGGYEDCGGCPYCKFDDAEQPSNVFRLIFINADTDQNEAIKQVEAVEEARKYVRVVTEVPLCHDLIFAIAFSPFNVVQYNLSNLHSIENLEWRQSVYLADKCGLYVALFLYPVIPTIVKVAQVIQYIERYKNVCDYFCIKFLETLEKPVFVDGFYNINGHVVSDKYIEENPDGGIQCSEEFTTKFISLLNSFVKPRKININICNHGKCY